MVNADGSNLTELSEPYYNFTVGAVFSDYGDEFYYVHDYDIFSVNMNTLTPQKILTLTYDITSLIQKEMYIYFYYDKNIYRANVDGANFICLTDSIDSIGSFDLQP